jgi:hypothetical protein
LNGPLVFLLVCVSVTEAAAATFMDLRRAWVRATGDHQAARDGIASRRGRTLSLRGTNRTAALCHRGTASPRGIRRKVNLRGIETQATVLTASSRQVLLKISRAAGRIMMTPSS